MMIALFAINFFCWSQDSLRTVQLEEVAISAVRAPQFAPVAKTDVNRKQIDQLYVGQHPIFLLEKLTPGLYSFSESGSSFANYGQLRLRGINQERINITLNGVPLNDMIDQGVFFSNFTDITSNFESIQVQRGVGTSSNGVSSYGGSINFESFNLQGKEAFSNLQLGAGSFDTFRGNFQHFSGINEKGWGFMSSFSKLTSDGFRENTDTDATSFFITGGYFGTDEVFKVTAFTTRSENGLGYNAVEDSILDSNPRFNSLTANDRDDFNQQLVQLQYNRTLNDRWRIGITGYYGGAGGDFFVDLLAFDSTIINVPLENDHFGSIFNASYSKNNFSFSTGVHAYTFRRENREELLPDTRVPYYLETSQKDEVSWYGKANYVVNKLNIYADLQIRTARLSISPDYAFIGIPSEGDLDYDWSFVNPRVGITYDATNDLSLYGSFGRSGREPTKIDLFGGFQLNASNFPIVSAGDNFSEEYVNDLEVGARITKKNIFIDGNLYFMRFENEIAPIGDVIAFGLQERRNISQSTRSGFELQWTYVPNQMFEFNGNFAYLSTNIDNLTIDGSDFRDVEHVLSPDIIANAQIVYQPMKRLSVSLNGRYLGDQFMELTNNPELTVPSSFITDFQATVEISDNIKLSGFINNIFDEVYYTFGVPSFEGRRAFFAQPDRNYFLSLNFNF